MRDARKEDQSLSGEALRRALRDGHVWSVAALGQEEEATWRIHFLLPHIRTAGNKLYITYKGLHEYLILYLSPRNELYHIPQLTLKVMLNRKLVVKYFWAS